MDGLIHEEYNQNGQDYSKYMGLDEQDGEIRGSEGDLLDQIETLSRQGSKNGLAVEAMNNSL